MPAFRFAAFVAAFALCPVLAPAQPIPSASSPWPNHPLKIVVPFPAGGSADVQSRVIADELAKAIGQPVLIDNKPGAGGNIAAAAAASAPADGHTLFMATTGTHSANISLYDKLPYDPVKDFVPLTLVAIYPQVIAPGEKFRAATLPLLIDELRAAARAKGSVTFGSSGIGSPTHLGGELFGRETGVTMLHVPYRGQGPALNDLMGGQLDIVFPSVADVLPFLQAGKIPALAIMNETRSKALPDLPTAAELGYPKLLSSIWAGLYTNAGTPPAVVARLNAELVKIIESPAFKGKFEPMGFEVRSTSSEAFRAFAEIETQRWGDIIRAMKIRAE